MGIACKKSCLKLVILCFFLIRIEFINALGVSILRSATRSSIAKYASRNTALIQKPLYGASISLFDGAAKENLKPSSTGKSSLPISSTNLLKNMVGAGVFSLNAKCSAISPSAFVPASGVIIMMAAWATYNFYAIAETCKLMKCSTYGDAWGKTVSENSKWIIQAVVTIAPIVSCLANCIVLTDILGLVYRVLGAPLWMYSNRNTVIFLLSTTILYPLCVQKDLSALKSTSAFGIVGHLSAMAALGMRLKDGSYKAGGEFFKSSLQKSMLRPTEDWSKMFVLASLLSYCFVCHYNAPRYYEELEGKESDSTKFLRMTSLSYALGAAIYIGTMYLGLSLFGAQSASFALNSFSTKDPLGIFARLAFGTSVLASFPLIFLTSRNWLTSLAATHAPRLRMSEVTALLLALIAALTSKFTDIGAVGSVAGALFGSSMMFVFPPIMYMRALYLDAIRRSARVPMGKIVVNAVLLGLGAAMGGFGTLNSIKAVLK